jgi:hypothetical protein
MFISHARIVLIRNINTCMINKLKGFLVKPPFILARWLIDDQGFLIMNIGCC